MFEIGFSFQNWVQTLTTLLFIWVAVVIPVLITHAPADILSAKIVAKDDNFNSKITSNILCV